MGERDILGRLHPESSDCLGCDREVFRDGEGRLSDYCESCLASRSNRPVKLGLLVIAPDETVLGAWVKRDGRDWGYEDV